MAKLPLPISFNLRYGPIMTCGSAAAGRRNDGDVDLVVSVLLDILGVVWCQRLSVGTSEGRRKRTDRKKKETKERL
jgi:hypothetical protein